ncbi:TolC family protein [Marinilabiliaceae bacterium ANBcel2]|nr:TolC family protein [Marinilabiliaceae bacterium ANBcel2]
MKFIKYIIVALILLTSSIGTVSQVSVTIDECRRDALDYNKSLDLSRMDEDYAKAAVKAARTAYFPKIDGSGSALYMPDFDGVAMPGFTLPTTEEAMAGHFAGTSGVDFPGYDLGMDDLQVYMAGVTAEQVVYAGGQVRRGNEMAQRGADIAREALNLTRSEVKHAVDKAFWSLYLVQQQVEVTESHVDALTTLEDQLKTQYHLGIIPRSEKLKVSVKRTEADLQLVEIKNMLNITSMNLARLTGRSLNEPLRASVSNDEVTESYEEVDFSSDFSYRSELEILSQKKEIARLERQSVLGEYLPQIGVNVGYRYIHVPDLTSGDWNITIGAGVSIPIFHWREKKHRTDMARISEKQAAIKLSDTEDQIALEVEQSRQSLDAGFDRVEVAKLNLEQAKETYSEVEISYDAGLNNITDLLNAQVGLQRASAMLVEARANLEILKSAYLKALGTL